MKYLSNQEWIDFGKELEEIAPKDLEGRTAKALELAIKVDGPVSLIRCTPRYGEGAGEFWGYNVSSGVYRHKTALELAVYPDGTVVKYE